MTTMDGIHDTETCDAANGHPCEQCQWADRQEHERRYSVAEQAALADHPEPATDPPFNPCDHGFPLGVMCVVCRAEDERFIATFSEEDSQTIIDPSHDPATCYAPPPNDRPCADCRALRNGTPLPLEHPPLLSCREAEHARRRQRIVEMIHGSRTPTDIWHDGYREGLAEGLRLANEDLRQLVEKERR